MSCGNGRGGHSWIPGRLVLASFVLAACQIAPAAPPAARYALTVANGRGGGLYAAGEAVRVWAEPPEAGWLFDRWMGDTALLADAAATYTTLSMPAGPARLAASYRAAPAWSPQQEAIVDRPVYYYFPPGASGVIVYFHGSGGEAGEWIESEAAEARFVALAVAAGYGLIATESGDRVKGQWDLSTAPGANGDLWALRAALAAFAARGWLPTGLPVYALGMSQGARFATLAAHALGFAATAIYVGYGQPEVLAVTSVPTIWCLGKNDPIIDAAEARHNYQMLRQRGVDTAFIVSPPAPLCADCFRGIDGLGPTESERLFAALDARGYLDEAGYLRGNPRLSKWEQEVAASLPDAARRDLRDRLWAAYAEHALSEACTAPVLRFFAEARGD